MSAITVPSSGHWGMRLLTIAVWVGTLAVFTALTLTVMGVLWFIREWVATGVAMLSTVDTIADGLILSVVITALVVVGAGLASGHGADDASPILTEADRAKV